MEKRERRPKGTVPPLISLEEAVQIAHKVHEKGGGKLTLVGLAHELGYSPSSSGFWRKVSVARQHGLIENQGDALSLTTLGYSVVAPTAEDGGNSLVESFRKIPTYQWLHDRYSNKILPSESDLTNVLIQEKKMERALALDWAAKFSDSAKTAGLTAQSGGKIVLLSMQKKSPQSTIATSPIVHSPDDLAMEMERRNFSGSQKGNSVVLHFPGGKFAEASFSPDLTPEELGRLIKMIEAYKSDEKGKK